MCFGRQDLFFFLLFVLHKDASISFRNDAHTLDHPQVKRLEDSHVSLCVPAIDHSNSYLTRARRPFKRQFHLVFTATRCIIYHEAQRETSLYIEFVLQLTHTKWKGIDIPSLLQSPFSIFPVSYLQLQLRRIISFHNMCCAIRSGSRNEKMHWI